MRITGYWLGQVNFIILSQNSVARKSGRFSTESKEYNHRIGVGNICPRCNCPYEPGDRIVFFPCGHGAHKNCCREGICTICLCMNNTK